MKYNQASVVYNIRKDQWSEQYVANDLSHKLLYVNPKKYELVNDVKFGGMDLYQRKKWET